MIELSGKDQRAVIRQIRDYANETFFHRYPHLREVTAVVIVDSVAVGLYDEYSDVDVKFIFPQEVVDRQSEEFAAYEEEIAQQNEHIQFIFRDTYEGLEQLAEAWDNDPLTGEFASALIVQDPLKQFAIIQQKLQWYPPHILREKLNWLFGQIVFQTEHFYTVSAAREDAFFNLIIKGRLIEMFMGITFLLNEKYPVGKKIYLYFQRLPYIPPGLDKLIAELLTEPSGKRGLELVRKGRQILEKELLGRELIPRADEAYWMRRKSKYTVSFRGLIEL